MGIYSRSVMTIPDGMPLAWVGRNAGTRRHAASHWTGPDAGGVSSAQNLLMSHTFFMVDGRVSQDELQDRIQQQFPWVTYRGDLYSSLSRAFDMLKIARINR